MDPAETIRTVTMQHAAGMNAHVSQMARSMNTFHDVDEIQSQFKSKVIDMKNDTQQCLQGISDQIQAIRPHASEANYWEKRQYYDQLVEHAYAHINYIEATFERTFRRLNNLFLRFSIWLSTTATEIYTALKSFLRMIKNRIRG